MAKLKLLHFTLILAVISTVARSETETSRKLDETEPGMENKCGGCPCNNPCNPPPSPPPPALPPPPPPPKKQPPPSNYCPPPPSGGGGGGGGQYPPNPPYIYINGPPGNLYPVDPFYSGSGRILSSASTPFLIAAALGLIALR